MRGRRVSSAECIALLWRGGGATRCVGLLGVCRARAEGRSGAARAKKEGRGWQRGRLRRPSAECLQNSKSRKVVQGRHTCPNSASRVSAQPARLEPSQRRRSWPRAKNIHTFYDYYGGQ